MKKNLLKLFLLAAVLIVGAGEMWGAYYWKGSAVPVGSGKVAMRQANVAAGAIDNWSASRVDSNFTTTATGYKYARYYAQPDEGKYFWGWYTDSECTEDSYFSDSNPYSASKKATRVSTNSASPTDFGTYYAKFADNPIYKYSITISASTDAYNTAAASRNGGVFTLNTIGQEGEQSGTSRFAYGKYCNVGAYQSNTGKTAVISSRSPETSKTERLYTTAVSRHIYHCLFYYSEERCRFRNCRSAASRFLSGCKQ